MNYKQEVNKRIIESIVRIRKKNKITQQALSEMIGKNNKYINLVEYEAEQISLPALIDIAETLDEPMEYFFMDQGSEEDISRRINRLTKRDREMVLSLLQHFEETANSFSEDGQD